MKKFLRLIEALLFLFVVLLLGILPRSISLKTGETLGLLMFLMLKSRKGIALKNIEIAQKGGLKLPSEPEHIVRLNFINLGRSVSELSMLSIGRTAIMNDIVFEGLERYQAAKNKNKGAVLITGHCGNWELLALAASWKGIPVSLIARQLNNPYINKFIEGLRTRFGNRVIYKKGAVREILGTIKDNGTVGILIDQSVLEDEAVVIEFFGEKVYAMKTPALLSIKTGAAIVPAFINYIGDGKHRIWCGKEIPLKITGDMENDLIYNTQAFSDYVEKYIKENPSEWLWIHRRWKLSHGRKY
ncbi:MAG: lysophospholipid acyltransferase family protein [Nitrospirae bacterium]|nr:lysophospholipid acyltransferase family protein [Nitrospirota bacterium]